MFLVFWSVRCQQLLFIVKWFHYEVSMALFPVYCHSILNVPKLSAWLAFKLLNMKYLWIIGTVQKYWLFSNNFFFSNKFFVVKFPWLLSFRMLTLNISFCVSLAGPVTLNARKGTLRRKRQLRELAEHHNMGYEEDLLDNTPYKKTRRHKVSSVMLKTIVYCLWKYSYNLFNCQHSVYNSSPLKGFH